MSDPLVHTGHKGVRFVRMQHDHLFGLPDGFVVPLDAGATVPTGWEEVPGCDARFIPGDVPSFGALDCDTARAAVDRFMAGETVIALAQEYDQPTDVIEGAIRWFATVED